MGPEVLLGAFVDRVIQLVNVRRNNKRELLSNVVEPLFCKFTEVHEAYMASFREYLALVDSDKKSFAPLLTRMERDRLFSDASRIRVQAALEVNFPPECATIVTLMKAYIANPFNFSEGDDCRKQIDLNPKSERSSPPHQQQQQYQQQQRWRGQAIQLLRDLEKPTKPKDEYMRRLLVSVGYPYLGMNLQQRGRYAITELVKQMQGIYGEACAEYEKLRSSLTTP